VAVQRKIAELLGRTTLHDLVAQEGVGE